MSEGLWPRNLPHALDPVSVGMPPVNKCASGQIAVKFYGLNLNFQNVDESRQHDMLGILQNFNAVSLQSML